MTEEVPAALEALVPFVPSTFSLSLKAEGNPGFFPSHTPAFMFAELLWLLFFTQETKVIKYTDPVDSEKKSKFPKCLFLEENVIKIFIYIVKSLSTNVRRTHMYTTCYQVLL